MKKALTGGKMASPCIQYWIGLVVGVSATKI